jgi:multidrug efflux system outer membrane protein
VDVATARRDQAFADYQQTVLEALGEVENGLVAFAQEQKTRGPLSEAAASARQAVEIAQGRYQAGLAEFLHVLQAEKTLQSSEDLLAQSEQRLALAVVAVYKALGGGSESYPSSLKSPESPAAVSR